MENYINGRFRPSKKLLEVLEATIDGAEEWILLGRQREAYNFIFFRSSTSRQINA